MNIQIQHYDRILLLHLEESVVEPDLVKVAGFINNLVGKVSCVVCDIHLAQLDDKDTATLLRLRAQYGKVKIRFLVVSPTLANADAATLADAIDLINNNESARITELFALDAELRKLRAEYAKVQAMVASKLGVKSTTEPASPQAPLPPHPIEAVEHALQNLADRNQMLLQVFKGLTGDIHSLQGYPSEESPGVVRVAEAKRRALDVIKAQGVID